MRNLSTALPRLFFKLFPGQCIVCKAATNRSLDLCAHCQRDLPYSTSACWQCGLSMTKPEDTCTTCILNPPIYSHCFSLFQYEQPVSGLINQFKSHNRLAVGRVLSILLARAYINNHSRQPDLWLAVPLHKSSLRTRGFNQAEEIAAVLADLSRSQLISSGVTRVKKTLQQKRLTLRKRKQNMSGAFETRINLEGLDIGIVDDVVTTGATVSALSESLIDAGAADVQIVCLARTATN